MRKPIKPATKLQLQAWLAQAMRFIPPNLCSVSPFEMPPKWVKDARRELKRLGVTYSYSEQYPSRKKKRVSASS